MDDNRYTYPESPTNFSFSEAEKKRWDQNLKKLIERVQGKFGVKKKAKKSR